jgi:hypothetical protein
MPPNVQHHLRREAQGVGCNPFLGFAIMPHSDDYISLFVLSASLN